MYDALRVYRAVEASGLTPNVVTACGLISALGKQRRRGERVEGYRLWRELQASGLWLDAGAYRTGEGRTVMEKNLLSCNKMMVGECGVSTMRVDQDHVLLDLWSKPEIRRLGTS